MFRRLDEFLPIWKSNYVACLNAFRTKCFGVFFPKLGILQVHPTPYLLDLAPSYFFLFPERKIWGR